MKTVIYGGGTITHVRNHLALCAPAFGITARYLKQQLTFADLRLTRMASETSVLITNNDVSDDIENIIKDPYVKFVIMNAALCDFHGQIGDLVSSKHSERLETTSGHQEMKLAPTPKVITYLRAMRPDIFIVGFKTTTSASLEVMAKKSRKMGVDMVLANDTVTRTNILYHNGFQTTVKGDRKKLLDAMAEIVRIRQGNLLYEDDKEVVMRVSCYYKMSLNGAETLAVSDYKNITGKDLEPSGKQWSNKQDGAIILTK
jgi:hypothetical protein